MATDVLQVQTTVPAESDGERIAAHLVDARLAACVQVVGPIRSTYRWQGQVEEAEEWLLLVKTTAAAWPAVAEAIAALHPYEEPELVAVPVVAGSAGYLDWVEGSVDRGAAPEEAPDGSSGAAAPGSSRPR
jgi:periplasmic divalent cation tolerance protein